MRITHPLDGEVIRASAGAGELDISATAQPAPGQRGLLGSPTEIQWVFPPIPGMRLRLDPPSGRGAAIRAIYEGPPSDGNPDNQARGGPEHPEYQITANQLNCSISTAFATVTVGIVFYDWKDIVFKNCSNRAFGGSLSFGIGLPDSLHKRLPTQAEAETLFKAARRGRERYGFRRLDYGPADLFTVWAIESEFKMRPKTEVNGRMDIGPGQINHDPWSAHERGMTGVAAEVFERDVFGTNDQVRDAEFDGDVVENLAFAWLVLQTQGHEGYNRDPQDRLSDPTFVPRMAYVRAFRPQLEQLVNCMTDRDYNEDACLANPTVCMDVMRRRH